MTQILKNNAIYNIIIMFFKERKNVIDSNIKLIKLGIT